MHIQGMTFVLSSPRQNGQSRLQAPMHLVGLAGQDGPGRRVALEALAAMGYVAHSCAHALYAEVATAWGIDARSVTPGDEWEIPLQALAAARCRDPFFVTWCARRQINLALPRAPRWAVMHWSLYRRETDLWAFLRPCEQWLLQQRLEGVQRVVLHDLFALDEHRLIRHWGGKVLQLANRQAPGPLGQPDAWVSCDDVEHLAARVTTTVHELFNPFVVVHLQQGDLQ